MCQPMNGLLDAEDDKEKRYWSLLLYDRKLTDKEVNDYELDYLGKEK